MACLFAAAIFNAWFDGYDLWLAQILASVLAGVLAASWSPSPKGRSLRD